MISRNFYFFQANEELDTDKKDRPLQDVKVANCGELIRKSKPTKKKLQPLKPLMHPHHHQGTYWDEMGQK